MAFTFWEIVDDFDKNARGEMGLEQNLKRAIGLAFEAVGEGITDEMTDREQMKKFQSNAATFLPE